MLTLARFKGTFFARLRELFIWASTIIDISGDSRGFILSNMVKSGRDGLRRGMSLAQMRIYMGEPKM